MSGVAFVPKEIIDRFPEINPANYDASDAIALNDWGIEVVLATRDSADVLDALKEANAFILAPAEDLREGVLSRIRDAIAKASA